MKMPKYMLIASGSVITPRLDIVLNSDVKEDAAYEAQKIVRHLSKNGYHVFDLFELNEGQDKFVESYRVETPEPVVNVLKR